MLTRLCLLAIALTAYIAVPAAQSDLDEFMAKVVARRDENWKKLQQYVLDERETFQLTVPGGARLYGFDRDYTWFPRDGFFIRSPLRADGVAIAEDDRRRAEESWLQREREREKRRGERDAARKADAGTAAQAPAAQSAPATDPLPSTIEDAVRQSVEPQFISSAYFLRFAFDRGTYALVGREKLLDREVLRIEYYPTRLYNDDNERERARDRERDKKPDSPEEQRRQLKIERQMNKVALVTIWVEPGSHQILQYELNNIDLDFLPGRQIVRVDDVHASMRMAQPFPDVWLPDAIAMNFRATLAIGDVAARYDVRYHEYRLASVTTRVR